MLRLFFFCWNFWNSLPVISQSVEQVVASFPQQGGQAVPVFVHQSEDPVFLRLLPLLLLLSLVLHKLHGGLLKLEPFDAARDVEQLVLDVGEVGLHREGELPLVVDGVHPAQVLKEHRPVCASLSGGGLVEDNLEEKENLGW